MVHSNTSADVEDQCRTYGLAQEHIADVTIHASDAIEDNKASPKIAVMIITSESVFPSSEYVLNPTKVNPAQQATP
jgi:hypothetical protein